MYLCTGAIGVGAATRTFSMKDIGDLRSASTAALTMDMVMAATVMRVTLAERESVRLQHVRQPREHHGDIHNTYNTRVADVSENRVSYNGGTGGVDARATAQQEAYGNQRHVGPVESQTQHVQEAQQSSIARFPERQAKAVDRGDFPCLGLQIGRRGLF